MREPIVDVDYLVKYLRSAGEIESNPILLDAADALEREHEKHISDLSYIVTLEKAIERVKGLAKGIKKAVRVK